MSHHMHDNAHIKQVLSDVIALSMSHIQDLALKLKELNITEENLATRSLADQEKSKTMNYLLHIINDAIHPAHNLAKEFFPGAADFIEMCKVNHKLAIERKLIASTCGCYSCKMKKPI